MIEALKLARSSKSCADLFDEMDTGSDPVRRGGFMPAENESQFSHSDVQPHYLWLIPCPKVNDIRPAARFRSSRSRNSPLCVSNPGKSHFNASHEQASCPSAQGLDTLMSIRREQ